MLELIQASVWRSRSLPTRSHPGEGGVRAAARPGESDLLLRSGVARGPIAEPEISRKIVAGQPQLSRFGEKLAELPPTGDQVALFRPRLGRLERTCINERGILSHCITLRPDEERRFFGPPEEAPVTFDVSKSALGMPLAYTEQTAGMT